MRVKKNLEWILSFQRAVRASRAAVCSGEAVNWFWASVIVPVRLNSIYLVRVCDDASLGEDKCLNGAACWRPAAGALLCGTSRDCWRKSITSLFWGLFPLILKSGDISYLGRQFSGRIGRLPLILGNGRWGDKKPENMPYRRSITAVYSAAQNNEEND